MIHPVTFNCDKGDCPVIINDGGAYHAVVGGKVFRFCCSAHRAIFQRARIRLMESSDANP